MRLSLEAHRVIETAVGFLLIAAPVVLDFDLGGFVLCAGSGALVAGASLAATREGRTATGSSHRSLDLALVALLVVAALGAAAVVTTSGPTVSLLAAAAAEGILTAITRYTESSDRDTAVEAR